jgi:acetylornithine deacetylase/succinyl-diaminopimelate desuccinylase-like protein
MRDAGLKPLVGNRFEVEFGIAVALTQPAAPRFVVGKSASALAKASPVAEGAFVARPEGSAGVAEGELVFVGYAARATASAAKLDGDGKEVEPAHPAYDDLAGVDLQGKIAVALLDAPGRPDFQAFFAALEHVAEHYRSQVPPLLDRGDIEGARAEFRRSLDEVASLLRPFLRGAPLDPSFFVVPDAPPAEIDLMSRLMPLAGKMQQQPGPAFAFSESAASTKVERLAALGASAVILVRGPSTIVGDPATVPLPRFDAPSKTPLATPAKIPVVQLDWRTADKLLRVRGKTLSHAQARLDRELEPGSAPLGRWARLEVQSQPQLQPVPNLVGTIPGTDLANELVVIGGHYDHIGIDGEGYSMCNAQTTLKTKTRDATCNGADDNGSGTAMVLALAEGMKARGARPRRTLVFALFAGEELGLMGSEALVDDPNFPTKDVVAMVNLDMVGRLDKGTLAIGGTGSSSAWMSLLERIGDHGLPILYDAAIVGRSDHASFFVKDIPVLFAFTGLHGDYHRPGDEVAEIDFDGMVKIHALLDGLLTELGAGTAVPFDPPTRGPEGIASHLPGTDPATVVKRVNVEEG